jgi:hypothetical protein
MSGSINVSSEENWWEARIVGGKSQRQMQAQDDDDSDCEIVHQPKRTKK